MTGKSFMVQAPGLSSLQDSALRVDTYPCPQILDLDGKGYSLVETNNCKKTRKLKPGKSPCHTFVAIFSLLSAGLEPSELGWWVKCSTTALKPLVIPGAGNPHIRGRISTIDLLVLTSSDQLRLILCIYYKTSNLNVEVNCTEPSPSVRVPCPG
jgi:hypothetical protein